MVVKAPQKPRLGVTLRESLGLRNTILCNLPYGVSQYHMELRISVVCGASRSRERSQVVFPFNFFEGSEKFQMGANVELVVVRHTNSHNYHSRLTTFGVRKSFNYTIRHRT